ncbi:MAG: hypothetical protein EXR51_10950 [Dehalococcoidia bacterium]|nr:hypothetical protein [Dehalococcoidia bacterium]
MDRSDVRPLTQVVRVVLLQERGLTDVAAVPLRMVLQKGRYAGRNVTYFRVFDPAAPAAGAPATKHYSDLDGAAALYSGHIEREGHVILNR